jgi:hypothetical protein
MVHGVGGLEVTLSHSKIVIPAKAGIHDLRKIYIFFMQ